MGHLLQIILVQYGKIPLPILQLSMHGLKQHMCLLSEGVYCPNGEESNSQKCGKSDLALKK
jgi:hypothetical protein